MTRIRSLITSSFAFSFAAVLLAGLFVHPAAAQEQGEIRTADYDVRELTYPDLRDFEVPEPERVQLDNGLTLLLLEDPELPQVNAVARIGVGSVYEPAEKRGVASITGIVMRSGGTASMSPDSLNTVIENVGATVETGIGETSGTAYMSTLAEHVDTILPVFAEVLRRPAFAEAKVQQAKSRTKSGITRRNDNARQIASRKFDQILYGEDSPYARTAELYTVDRIQRQDLVEFHDQYVHPNNVILSVWGDFDADRMEQKIREQFGDWTAPSDFEPPTPPTPEADREYSVNFVPKSDVTQSTVYMGHAGDMTRRSDDYAAVTVMNEVLTAPFTGRLFNTVRSEKGLAYSVGGQYTAGYNRPGRFFAAVFSKSASTVEATQATMTEVRGMKKKAPTQQELSLAKDSYLNSFVFNFDSEREILSRRATYEYYDYPSDFLQQTKTAIEEVTADDVLSVSKKYLHPDEAHILVVGNGEKLSQELSTLTEGGAVDTLDISIPREPPSAGQDAPTAAEKEAMTKGRDLMASAKKALGGTAFDQVENMRVVTKQAGRTATLVVAFPDKMRVERGGLTIVTDGETVKMKKGQQTRTLPSSMKGRITAQLWRSLPYLMANLDRDGLSVTAQGEKTVDGTSYRAVRVDPPTGGGYTLYLDTETMQPRRMKREATRRGKTTTVRQTFSDYREVQGMTVPFKTVTKQGGRTINATVQNLKVNVDLTGDPFTLSASSE
jgi:predicted Zn-dependent peptidase/outer membrane lipoprotein-sorting protein